MKHGHADGVTEFLLAEETELSLSQNGLIHFIAFFFDDRGVVVADPLGPESHAGVKLFVDLEP